MKTNNLQIIFSLNRVLRLCKMDISFKSLIFTKSSVSELNDSGLHSLTTFDSSELNNFFYTQTKSTIKFKITINTSPSSVKTVVTAPALNVTNTLAGTYTSTYINQIKNLNKKLP